MQPPLILVDNVFDAVNLYPAALLTSSGAAAGSDVRNVANYRRERDFWKAATSAADRYVQVDLGAGVTRAVDACWIDRGHNLWGLTVEINAGDDGVAWPNTVARVVPAQGTVGGDPATGWCVTEEGALYTLFNTFTARRYLRVKVNSVAQPIITGVILGARTQLAGYSSELDEDAGERTERSQQSDAGYTAVDRVYPGRTLKLALDTIGATEYDAKIRALRSALFEKNQPAFVVMNYGAKPERGWLYRFNARSWAAPMSRVHRKCIIALREEGSVIR